jgi:UDP-2-acetamido-3-amino-2,3-dideoxy-glucuronate N-acetyltransferase
MQAVDNTQSNEYYRHPQGIVEPDAIIGSNTRIWAFAHILGGARIGNNCNICDGVFVEQDVILGDRVTVKCGVQLWNGMHIEDDVFIGPNATFTNDIFPRSLHHLPSHPKTVLEQGCSIGGNATVLPGLRIGRNAMVGAGSVVTRNVPPNAIVTGNPAQISGYISDGKRAVPTIPDNAAIREHPVKCGVKGVVFHRFRVHQDLRGDLSVAEYPSEVPFSPKRHFIVFNVPSKEVRGEHAHRTCKQYLICVSGSCHVVADDGVDRQEFVLKGPAHGLYLPPMTWASQYRYSSDAVLLVLASEYYDPGDYIRDYSEFLDAVAKANV